MYQRLSNRIVDWLTSDFDLSHDSAIYLKTGILLLILAALCWIVWFFGRQAMLAIIHRAAKRTKTTFDDAMVHEHVFARLAQILPALIIDYTAPLIFAEFPETLEFIYRVTDFYIIWVLLHTTLKFFNALRYWLEGKDSLKDKPIASYVQLGKIIVWIIFTILLLSVLMGKSPVYFLSAMGALTAVLLLVFKDTILGFVGSIQLSANDMVRKGDWVTMERYGADGDVLEINLTTVKVKNFDHTITTIPTYSMITDSFRNWRGMSESDGRRIMRNLMVKADSIHFLKTEQVQDLKKISLLKEFLEKRQQEIDEYNAGANVDTSMPMNGRNMTNIGVFRNYIHSYLMNNPNINTDLTCMVRQLEGTPNGVPLQVYAFSKTKAWVQYEAIVSDIFDHLLTVAPYFGLELFQNPAGSDFRQFGNPGA